MLSIIPLALGSLRQVIKIKDPSKRQCNAFCSDTMSQSLGTNGLGFFLAVGRTGINSVELQYLQKNAVELIKIFLPSLPLVSPSLQLFASCIYMYTQMYA